jgi:methyl coenzyme M reductase beta subunit
MKQHIIINVKNVLMITPTNNDGNAGIIVTNSMINHTMQLTKKPTVNALRKFFILNLVL